MLFVLSPAKTLDFESPLPSVETSKAAFLGEAETLIRGLRTLDAEGIARLMELSPALAELNHERYRHWRRRHDSASARPCVLAFAGDVYEGLSAQTLGVDELLWTQRHLRILSGLYGLLRPLDRIRPYRLEMGTRFANERGKDLYAFWGDRLARALSAELNGEEEPVLVNLASVEYFKAVPVKALGHRVIQPVFQEKRADAWKIVSFMAKRARGLMVRYAIDQQIDRSAGLQDFDYEGYRFDPKASDANTWVYRRTAQQGT
jgi:cytoplasmic iron level regulating protein YaaA (DUF328/UPF0246 family)